jgi:hypothetical protein
VFRWRRDDIVKRLCISEFSSTPKDATRSERQRPAQADGSNAEVRIFKALVSRAIISCIVRAVHRPLTYESHRYSMSFLHSEFNLKAYSLPSTVIGFSVTHGYVR